MNPLTVTWSPHIYTEIGKINFYNMIENGFDNILITPNSKVHKLLTKLAFLNLGHPFQPFIIGQRVVGPKVAIEKKIPLVFYGENVAEYGNNLKENYSPLMDKNLITAFDVDDENLLLSGVKIKKLKSHYKLTNNDLECYRSPKIHDLNKLDVQVHYMSYYENGLHKIIFITLLKILILKLQSKEHKELIQNQMDLMINWSVFTTI